MELYKKKYKSIIKSIVSTNGKHEWSDSLGEKGALCKGKHIINNSKYKVFTVKFSLLNSYAIL